MNDDPIDYFAYNARRYAGAENPEPSHTVCEFDGHGCAIERKTVVIDETTTIEALTLTAEFPRAA